MKIKSFLNTLLLVSTVSTTILAQEVNTQQWTLIHERTADWCTICGGWAWDFKNRMIDEFASKPVVFVAAHHSGGLTNPAAQGFGTNFDGAGQPIFYVNGVNINATSGNQTAKLNDTKDEVDFNMGSSPFAGVGINATLNDATDVLTVDAKVKFLEKVEGGDYHLALYLLEDVNSFQANRGSSALHKGLMRASLIGDSFGKSIVSGAVDKDREFVESITVNSITQKKENIHILGVIWNKVNGKYLFFNANKVKVNAASSTEEDVLSQNITAFASESGDVVLEIETEQNLSDVQAQLTDINGRVLKMETIGDLTIGKHTFTLPTQGASGSYITSIRYNGKITSKVVIIP
jgi:hypothetical protein